MEYTLYCKLCDHKNAQINDQDGELFAFCPQCRTMKHLRKYEQKLLKIKPKKPQEKPDFSAVDVDKRSEIFTKIPDEVFQNYIIHRYLS